MQEIFADHVVVMEDYSWGQMCVVVVLKSLMKTFAFIKF